MMNHEYIIPMAAKAGDTTLYPSSFTGHNGGNGITNSSHCTSLKPQMHCSSPSFVSNYALEGNYTAERNHGASPEFPLDLLKNLTIQMLTEAVTALCQEVRDPVGGTIELLLVPLIKLAYSLLVMGVLEDEDLGKVLRLLDSEVSFTNSQSSMDEEKEDEKDDEKKHSLHHHQKDSHPKIGLLQIKLPEAVKLEVSEPQFFSCYICRLLKCLKQTIAFLHFIPSSVTCCPTCVIVRCAKESKLWLLFLTLLCVSCRRTNASATMKSCKRSICLLLLLRARPRSSAHLHGNRF